MGLCIPSKCSHEYAEHSGCTVAFHEARPELIGGVARTLSDQGLIVLSPTSITIHFGSACLIYATGSVNTR